MSETLAHTAETAIPVSVEHTAPAGPALRVLALGPLEVSVGGRVIEPGAWGSARPRELLVYLLMHPDGRTKEQVGLAFWPEASSAQVRNSFHVTLHRLRKALGGTEWVTLVGERYVVDRERIEMFDAIAFEADLAEARRALTRQAPDAVARLEAALARYRGDFLDGEPIGDWHLEHRDRLQRMHVEALMQLGAAHARSQRHARAADAYRRVLVRDELHEEALRELMRALAEAGERSQALRAYQRFAERLRSELDAEPDRVTRELCDKLQSGSPASVPARLTEGGSAVTAGPPMARTFLAQGRGTEFTATATRTPVAVRLFIGSVPGVSLQTVSSWPASIPYTDTWGTSCPLTRSWQMGRARCSSRAFRPRHHPATPH